MGVRPEEKRERGKGEQGKTISVSKRPYDRLLKKGARSLVSHNDRDSTKPHEHRREKTRTACRTKTARFERGRRKEKEKVHGGNKTMIHSTYGPGRSQASVSGEKNIFERKKQTNKTKQSKKNDVPLFNRFCGVAFFPARVILLSAFDRYWSTKKGEGEENIIETRKKTT
jgi:hypothetical protein